ncbi:MAG TPA: sugar ABC transporter permease [Candidatus Atribacteria bacterium]|nr:sugar ABC transporter permease [Candidatus Atribacteria bacterium]
MRKWTPYFLLIPTFIIIVLFIYMPAGVSLQTSLYRVLPFGRGMRYIGLQNFFKLFANSDYLYSVRFTILYVATTVGITILSSFLIALLMVKKIPGVRFYRTLIFAPYAISPAIAGVLWTFLLNPVVGHVSYFFQTTMGIQVEWLTSKPHAFYAIIFASVWKILPFDMIFYIASIQNVPEEILESAMIEGASPMNSTWKIIFPLVSPITFYLVIMTIVTTMFSSFAIIDVMTKGGPGQYTTNMIYRLYLDGFYFQKAGVASAQSIVLIAIMIVVTMVYFKFGERFVHYQ